MVKVVEEGLELINVSEMKCGDLGVIHSPGMRIDGTVVQMVRSGHSVHADFLVSVGRPNGKTWRVNVDSPVFKIRPLRPGTKLVVCDE